MKKMYYDSKIRCTKNDLYFIYPKYILCIRYIKGYLINGTYKQNKKNKLKTKI